MTMRSRALAPAICVLLTATDAPALTAGGIHVAPVRPGGAPVSVGPSAQPASGGAALADRRLADAAQRREIEAVRALLDDGADVDAPQADGATALAWAVHWDDLATAGLLLAAGADANAANDLGVTPLMLASQNGSVPMVELLVRAGADPNAARPAGGTALMMAARSGDATVLRRLIAAGADVDAATRSGHTALMWAVAERHRRAVALLAEVGGRRAGAHRGAYAAGTDDRPRGEGVEPVRSRQSRRAPAGRGPGSPAAGGRIHAAALRGSGR